MDRLTRQNDYRSNLSFHCLQLVFALVMDGPVDLPGFATVARGFPAPIYFVGRDVLPDHALQNLCAITDGFALEDHVAILEVTDEIKIASFVVDPRLFPMAGICVEDGDACAANVHRFATREILLHDAAVHDAPDAVGAVAHFAWLFTGPVQIPLANPKIKLFLLLSFAGSWLGFGRCLRKKGKSEERERKCRQDSHLELPQPQT